TRAVRADRANDAEGLIDPTAGHGPGRLVHAQNLRVVGGALRDLDHLLLCDAELAYFGLGIDVGVEAAEQCPSLLVEPARVDDEWDASTRLSADEDVLGRGQVRHEAELLMDDADAELLRGTRSGDVHVGALQADPPGVHAVDAGEDLHERRLAGAVFADERVDLTSTKLEVRVAEGVDAGEV